MVWLNNRLVTHIPTWLDAIDKTIASLDREIQKTLDPEGVDTLANIKNRLVLFSKLVQEIADRNDVEYLVLE